MFVVVFLSIPHQYKYLVRSERLDFPIKMDSLILIGNGVVGRDGSIH